MGFPGNERADAVARRAAKGTSSLVPIPYTDYCNSATERITDKWNNRNSVSQIRGAQESAKEE